MGYVFVFLVLFSKYSGPEIATSAAASKHTDMKSALAQTPALMTDRECAREIAIVIVKPTATAIETATEREIEKEIETEKATATVIETATAIGTAIERGIDIKIVVEGESPSVTDPRKTEIEIEIVNEIVNAIGMIVTGGERTTATIGSLREDGIECGRGLSLSPLCHSRSVLCVSVRLFVCMDFRFVFSNFGKRHFSLSFLLFLQK